MGWNWSSNNQPPYRYSGVNRFMTVGCDDMSVIVGFRGRNFSGGCITLCRKAENVIGGSCSGIGCCQTSVPEGFQLFFTSLFSFMNHTRVSSFNLCSHAFLGDPSEFHFRGAPDLSNPNFADRITNDVSIVVDWAIGNVTCTDAQNLKDYACRVNSQCVDSSTRHGGYRCTCMEGYEGNPYLDLGCTGIFLSS